MRESRREHDDRDGPDRAPARGPDPDLISKLGDLAAVAGLRRVAILAWRDLDDPEAGGSELHASRVASLWAEAGIEVTMRTSYAAGHPQVTWRGGYRVIRKAGRYLVFPRAAFSEMMGWHGASDGLVEIWNGMPFFSPVWARRPTAVWLHHVHDTMWEMTLSPRLAKLGRLVEFDVAPRLYRRTPIVTLSESSKSELVRKLRFKPENVTVVPPGVDASFAPGGRRDPTPFVVAVCARSSSARDTSGSPSSVACTSWLPSSGSRSPAACPKTSSSVCTGGPGCSRAPRRTKAGA